MQAGRQRGRLAGKQAGWGHAHNTRMDSFPPAHHPPTHAFPLSSAQMTNQPNNISTNRRWSAVRGSTRSLSLFPDAAPAPAATAVAAVHNLVTCLTCGDFSLHGRFIFSGVFRKFVLQMSLRACGSLHSESLP